MSKGLAGFSYHPKCKRTNIVGLLFADDLLIFCKGDLQSVRLIKKQLSKFSEASGLCVNKDKCDVYFAGVPSDI